MFRFIWWRRMHFGDEIFGRLSFLLLLLLLPLPCTLFSDSTISWIICIYFYYHFITSSSHRSITLYRLYTKISHILFKINIPHIRLPLLSKLLTNLNTTLYFLPIRHPFLEQFTTQLHFFQSVEQDQTASWLIELIAGIGDLYSCC